MRPPGEPERVEVSVVLPTRDRAAALRETFPDLVRLERVDELVVVDDDSHDDTPQFLASVGDPRMRVLQRRVHGGLPAAKNAGVEVAQGEWILFGEDDCRFPHDYAAVLLAEAELHRADIVSAPMVHARSEAELPGAVDAARLQAGPRTGLDEVVRFPRVPTVTPLLQAPSLVRRSVFERVRFDESLGVVAYREETDFYLRATYAGFVCLLTPRTFFWEPRRWPGGCTAPFLARELAHARNNWRFLRRHRAWLSAHGYVSSPAREQLRFVRRRLQPSRRGGPPGP